MLTAATAAVLTGVTSYGAIQGDWFVWGGFNCPQNRNAFGMNRSRRIAKFVDGTSQTLMAAEVKNEELGDPTFAAINSRSYHPGGVNALLADGSVRFVKSTIDGMVWRGLGTVAGGEVISSDSY
jgi:prepilin-type processing-associated H-X9-DG protein